MEGRGCVLLQVQRLPHQLMGISCTPTCASGALNTKEKALLVNSFVHTQSKKEQRPQSAGPASLTWSAKAMTQLSPPTGPGHPCQDEVPSGTNEYARCTPSRLAAADRFSTEHARRVARCVIADLHPADHTRCRVRYLTVNRRPHRARQERCQVRLRTLKARGARQERCRGFPVTEEPSATGRHRDATASNKRTRCSHSTAAIRCHRSPRRHVLDTDKGM